MQHIWQRSLWHKGTLHFSFSYSSSQNLAVEWIGSKGFAQLLKASNSSGSSALSHYSMQTYFSETIFLGNLLSQQKTQKFSEHYLVIYFSPPNISLQKFSLSYKVSDSIHFA